MRVFSMAACTALATLTGVALAQGRPGAGGPPSTSTNTAAPLVVSAASGAVIGRVVPKQIPNAAKLAVGEGAGVGVLVSIGGQQIALDLGQQLNRLRWEERSSALFLTSSCTGQAYLPDGLTSMTDQTGVPVQVMPGTYAAFVYSGAAEQIAVGSLLGQGQCTPGAGESILARPSTQSPLDAGPFVVR